MTNRPEFHFPLKTFNLSVINTSILMKWEEVEETGVTVIQHH